MKLRTTLAVLLIGLLAWGVIKLMGEPPKPTSQRQPLVPEEIIAGWKEIDLDLLSDQDLQLVQEPGAVMIRFGSDRDGHRMMYRDRADVDKVLQLLRALRDSWREPMRDGSGAELKDALLRAGLDPPRFHLAIRDGREGKAGEVALGFGNEDPTGQGILARCYGDNTLFRTTKEVANLLEYNLRDWRDRTVFTLDPLAVTRIDVVHDTHQAGKEPEILTLERQGNQSWRIVAPRSLVADAPACQSLAQQISLLRIATFVGQEMTKEVRAVTHLPDDPEWSLQVSAGSAIQSLDVGAHLSGQGYACRMTQRDENLVFAVEKGALDAILGVAVDSLRPKRLFPRIETALVSLECLGPDGKTTRWLAEREGRNPRGSWFVKAPFEGKANEGKGGKETGSFAQVVVDVDRTEVLEFLPAGTPFTPEATIALRWFVQRSPDPLVATRSLEVARDRERQRTLVRDTLQPDELFAVGEKFGALLDLDLELYRDRAIFPKKEQFQPKLVHWKLEVPGDPSKTLEVIKKGTGVPEPVGRTPTLMSPKLQGAPSDLLGSLCAGYVRAQTVTTDPFAKVAFMLTLGTPDGDRIVDETLIVQGNGPDAPDGLYCKLTPRLPDDVWMIVPRGLLEPLFRLLQ